MVWNLVSALLGIGVGMSLLAWSNRRRDRGVSVAKAALREEIVALTVERAANARRLAYYRETEIRADERRVILEEAQEALEAGVLGRCKDASVPIQSGPLHFYEKGRNFL